MANVSKFSFEFIGQLSLAEDTEKVPHYNIQEFENKTTGKVSTLKTLRLKMKCGEDNFFPRISGWGGNKIYTLDKVFKKLEFPASDYEKHLDNIAPFKKFIFKDDSGKVEFAREFEFIDYVNLQLGDNDYSDRLMRVKGEVEMSSYTDKEGNFRTFTNYNVQTIYVADEDNMIGSKEVTPHAKGSVVGYVSDNCVDITRMIDEGIVTINYYLGHYDKRKKDKGMFSYQGYKREAIYKLSEDSYKRDKQVEVLKDKIFRCEEGKIAFTGFTVNLVNRGGKVAFDESMLTEEEKEDIELGLTTLEDVIAEHETGMSEYVQFEEITGFKKQYRQAGSEQLDTTLKELLMTHEDKQESFNIDDSFEEVEDDEFGDLFDDVPF